MRVISGIYKGKKLEGFDIEGTRPTMDRVKESLFGMIQNYIPESTVLDLFAGTGSLGIEAMSNGASKCYFIDNSSKILPHLKNNLTNIPNTQLLNMDYTKALAEITDKLDVIFLDPPYYEGIMPECLKLISEYQLLNKKGIIVCEYDKKYILEDIHGLTIIKERTYGDKKITVYGM